MGFLDSLIDVGSSAWSWFKGDSISSNLAKTATMALIVNQIGKALSSSDSSSTDTAGTQTQVNPSITNSIPVVYGSTYIQGSITDAALTNNNQTMWYCITLCEKTGTLMSSGADSVISFDTIYWNDLEIVFKSDGYTVDKIIDVYGNTSTDISGLVKIYPFNNGSLNPCKVGMNSNKNGSPANSLFPGWSSYHTMSNLVFALVSITYDADKQITGLGDLKFKLTNTLTMPGDVLYDYLMNPIYGAGLDQSELNYA